MEKLQKKRFLANIYIYILAVVLVFAVSAGKRKNGYVNYQNADATYHTLLTLRCYEETPASIHKFLPIVSLGGEDNKWISWGATIPDEYGNYYYTSFSPAGYFLPYGFMKLFHLPISADSLYIFNSCLFALSSLLTLWLIQCVYSDVPEKRWLLLIGAAVYIFSPQLLHDMGMVYWHQSVMQVTLPMQWLAYYYRRNNRTANLLFYFCCLVNPYIEWTGYVANVGFALAELFRL